MVIVGGFARAVVCGPFGRVPTGGALVGAVVVLTFDFVFVGVRVASADAVLVGPRSVPAASSRGGSIANAVSAVSFSRCSMPRTSSMQLVRAACRIMRPRSLMRLSAACASSGSEPPSKRSIVKRNGPPVPDPVSFIGYGPSGKLVTTPVAIAPRRLSLGPYFRGKAGRA